MRESKLAGMNRQSFGLTMTHGVGKGFSGCGALSLIVNLGFGRF
jgi:hypothetical protein